MFKSLKNKLFILAFATVLPLISGGSVSATDCSDLSVSGGIDCAKGGGQTDKELTSIIPTIINIAMYAVGIISVIILIVAGIMYATAAGDEAKAKKAQKAIVGAIIGLVIAILAWTITNFVYGALK